MTEFSQTSAVGALTLPLSAGTTNQKLQDPIVEALLDFLAFSLNNDLSAKLAKLIGTSATAVPTSNRFSFDPFEPRGHSVKRPVPSLYVWWDGNSEPLNMLQIRGGRMRNISCLYVFGELPGLAEMNLRSGLFNAVDACFFKAADRGYHPSYSYNGAENGTELDRSIGSYLWDWSYLGGQGVQRVGIDDQTLISQIRRTAGRHYPAFAARFRVRELIEEPQPTDPDDVLRDSEFTLYHDGAEIFDRVLDGADGTEEL